MKNEALDKYLINMMMSTTVAYSAKAYVKHMPTIVAHSGEMANGVGLFVFLHKTFWHS